MPLESSDLALLLDIRAAAAQIRDFIQGFSHSRYLGDPRTQRAVERDLEIIGEAAGSLSEAARARYPSLPWKSMVGLRNILIHNYGRIDPGRIWETVTKDLAPLLSELSGLEKT